MAAYLVTHSLLSSWLHLIRENPYEDLTTEGDPLAEFMLVLRREPTPRTEAMQNGIDFENLVTSIVNGHDIENRERVRDNGSPTVDAGLAEIIRSFEDNLGGFPPAAREDLLGWREIFTDDLILLAIKKAALAGVRKWSYVNGILKVWKNEGVRTLGDVQSRDERRKPPAGQQPKRSAAEDYNEIFGELLGGST